MSDTPSFGVRFTRSWVGMYTGGLPAGDAERRRLEIESDLYEQLDMTGDDGILGRCLRGMTADVGWRIRTLRENAGQPDESQLMTVNPMRKWWVGLVLIHIAFTAISSLPFAIISETSSDPPAAIAMAVISLIQVTLMGLGLFAQRTRPVGGSWLIVIGLLPAVFSITAVGILIFGFWTANLILRKTTLEAGYETVAARNQGALARTWWIWLVAAFGLFGVGWVGLVVDNWFLWILPWVVAAFTALLGVAGGITAYTSRHRTRAA